MATLPNPTGPNFAPAERNPEVTHFSDKIANILTYAGQTKEESELTISYLLDTDDMIYVPEVGRGYDLVYKQYIKSMSPKTETDDRPYVPDERDQYSFMETIILTAVFSKNKDDKRPLPLFGSIDAVLRQPRFHTSPEELLAKFSTGINKLHRRLGL